MDSSLFLFLDGSRFFLFTEEAGKRKEKKIKDKR